MMFSLDIAQGDGVVEDGVAGVVVETPGRLGEDHVLQNGKGPPINYVRTEGRGVSTREY